eukprot:4419935-Pleurochrysis_carterae.AAC.1
MTAWDLACNANKVSGLHGSLKEKCGTRDVGSNRLNSLVRSSTVKCTGVPFSACAARQFARARPPTPAPEMITWSGFVSSIASARGPVSKQATHIELLSLGAFPISTFSWQALAL